MAALIEIVAVLVLPAALIHAAVSDLVSFTIPNRLPLALIGAFAVAAALGGMDLPTLGMHAAAGGVVLVFGFAFFAFGWIGGGDAKLAAAAALWLGFGALVPFLVVSALCGGALTLAILAFRSVMIPAFAIRQPWINRLHDLRSGIPYGVAIAAGALLVLPQTPWIAVLAS